MTNPAGDAPRWTRFVGKEGRPLEVHEGTFVGPDGRTLNLVAASREALVSVGAQIDDYARQLRPVDTGEVPDDGLLLATVDHGVRELLTLLEGHDALDVMAMLRQYVMPPDLAMWAESGSTLRDSWAAAEVVALVLLGLGLPSRDPTCDERTAAVIPQLVDNAAVIVQLATIAGVTRWSAQEVLATTDAGLNTLAWRLSSHETTVRGRQYPQVAVSINDVVLRTGHTGTVFQDLLGFTYDDVLQLREAAAIEHCGRNHEQAYDHIRAAAEAGPAAPLDDATAAAFRAVFETPSQLVLVTPSQLAERTHLVVNVVEAILDRFSIQPDGRPPDVLVRQFIDGRNPMAGRAILHAPDRGYLLLPGAIALDEIRRICEAPIKGTKRWTRYGRARDGAVETLVVDTLAALLDGAADVHRNLRYRDPGVGNDLSANSNTHQTAPVTEADGLLVLDGVALCVEVKAGDFPPRTRQGGVAQLDGDLDKTVKNAAAQADRLRQLIEHHHGLWLENGTWLDLADIHEIHSVVACLDDLGPIALATSELVQAGILTQTHLHATVTSIPVGLVASTTPAVGSTSSPQDRTPGLTESISRSTFGPRNTRPTQIALSQYC